MDYGYERLANAIIAKAWFDAKKAKRAYEKEYVEFLKMFSKNTKRRNFENAFKKLCNAEEEFRHQREWFETYWFEVLSRNTLSVSAVLEKLDGYGKEKRKKC